MKYINEDLGCLAGGVIIIAALVTGALYLSTQEETQIDQIERKINQMDNKLDEIKVLLHEPRN